MRLKYIIIFVLLIIAIVLFSMIQKNMPLEVETAVVSRGDIEEFIEERARTQYHETFTVAVLVSGFVRPITIEEGDKIQKGQILATVEDTQYESAVREADEQVNNINALIKGVDAGKPKKEEKKYARIALEIAKTELESVSLQLTALSKAFDTANWLYLSAQKLFEEKKISELELNTKRDDAFAKEAFLKQQQALVSVSKLRVEAAEASLSLVSNYDNENEFQREAYKAQINSIKNRLITLRDQKEKTVVTSPISGVVLNLFSRGNRMMLTCEPLMLIGNPESLELRVDILTDDVAKVAIGQKTKISCECLSGKIVTGKVAKILPTGFLKTSTLGVEQERIGVIIELNDLEVKLGPIYGVDVKIITKEKTDVLLVSERAVFKIDGETYVFVIKGEKAQLVRFRTGIKNDVSYEVVDGLSEGDIVITTPPPELKEGTKVKSK
ncbi:MAG: efflux RND transporter periplasmic adaptor subunit [Planctomycetota bacterium]